ncbi:MAG TPA: hypothetical protein VM262_00300 [Acidimicrobiales bacterium]|nr:hypothetical protein [Acidimicrobiales bacterium]
MWPSWRRDLAALGACLVLGWLGLRGQRVPILAGADLGFHELGHLVCYVIDAVLPWPEVLTAAAGSAFQVGVPLGLSLYFAVGRRDHRGAAVCLAWAATAAADVARYIADAPYEALPLIGGTHDWATVLGPAHLDRLHAAADVAAAVDRAALALFGLAVLVAVSPAILAPRPSRAAGPAAV